jgi:hypothetical protein
MFIVSVRLSPKKVLAATLAVVVVVSASVTAARYLMDRNEARQTIGGTQLTQPDTETAKLSRKKTTAKTDEARAAFIAEFGWEVDAEPAEVTEVIIPKEFDELYTEYNSMQKVMGFDLLPHAGDRVKRYSFTVKNHPQQKENVRANLLVDGNRIIGADISSTEAGGFMQGLTME